VGPIAATTNVEGDIDGGTLRECYQQVQQQPPPKLKEMSMGGPLGGATGRSDIGHHWS
jgi:hypothetical protein